MTTSTSVSLVKPDVLASGRVLTSMTIPKMDRYYCVVSPNFCSFNDRYELIDKKHTFMSLLKRKTYTSLFVTKTYRLFQTTFIN